VKEASTSSSPCNAYYFMVERLAGDFAIYPIGNLHHSNWVDDERILAAVKRLDHGRLYLDCARLHPGSESIRNLIRLSRRVARRNSRLVLCNLQPILEEVLRIVLPDHLRLFDIHDGGLPGSGPRLPDPSSLAWNNSTIPKIAQAIYEDGVFDRLPVLADALEEAGCINEDILNHCRQAGEHVPRCWLIDLLRRK
jgi:anti-anti-sigma regulatory factor